MIRFIDLRDQIMDVEDTPVHFAFYDTVTDRFMDIGGFQDWVSLADFLEDHENSGIGAHESRRKERFIGLMPEWAKVEADGK